MGTVSRTVLKTGKLPTYYKVTLLPSVKPRRTSESPPVTRRRGKAENTECDDTCAHRFVDKFRDESEEVPK